MAKRRRKDQESTSAIRPSGYKIDVKVKVAAMFLRPTGDEWTLVDGHTVGDSGPVHAPDKLTPGSQVPSKNYHST